MKKIAWIVVSILFLTVILGACATSDSKDTESAGSSKGGGNNFDGSRQHGEYDNGGTTDDYVCRSKRHTSHVPDRQDSV